MHLLHIPGPLETHYCNDLWYNQPREQRKSSSVNYEIILTYKPWIFFPANLESLSLNENIIHILKMLRKKFKLQTRQWSTAE